VDVKPVKFYFRAGNLALDFVNTVGNRLSENERRDYFRSPDEFIRWVAEAGLSSPGKNGRNVIAVRDVQKAIAFRESLYRLFLKEAQGKPPQPEDLRGLNGILAKHRSRMQLTRRNGGYEWRSGSSSSVDWILAQVAEAAAALLTSAELSNLKICQNETCGWFFVDRSRNLPRRWCSMEDCGNVAKARRHYGRIRTAAGKNKKASSLLD
jgi:predicted RNA-binding Zn ribbon-like protein